MFQTSSKDPYYLQDIKEFNMSWSSLSFSQRRLEHHPDHVMVPPMPTFPAQEEISEASPLQYKQPVYISDKPDVEALLGESKRSSTKLPDRNSLLVDLGSRINLIG